MTSPAPKRGISDRISIFEKGAASPSGNSSVTSSPVSNTSSPASAKYPATRTLSGKNFHALKSQFDKSQNNRGLTSPPPPSLEEEPSSSSPPPPPPRSAPPSSPPAVPKRSSVTSKPSPHKAKLSPKASPTSSGKTSPTGSKSSSTASTGRKSPPNSKSKATPPVVKATPTKKKPVGSSPTTPIPRNLVKKAVSRTTSSPIHQNSQSSPPSGAGGTPHVKKQSKVEVTPPKTVPESQPLKPMELEINNQNNNVEEAISLSEKVPMIEVNLENTPPSATSTPINLNSKPEPQAIEEADLKVVNKNFINSAVTGGNRYWTNQALQNDNSTKISQAMKLDLDYKEEKINSLTKEIEELSQGGASEEELASLKRQRADFENRLKDQEEELDDLAGQVQMLEAAKTKLEMSMAAIKKEHRRELASKEEELEDVRAAAQKKVKVLEQQLENEHEERINFVREKHELETRIINLQEMASRSTDEEQVSKLKKDLKRTKALLKDAQLMVESSRNESSNKVVLRQLKNQLEDAEFAKTAAIKAKQNIELELGDVQQQLDDVMRSKSDVEDRLMRCSREKTDFASQLEDNEEELHEVMKKFKASVAQLGVDQITIQEQSNRITDLEEEKTGLKSQLNDLMVKITSLEGENLNNPTQSRLELKVKELESKLELEQTTRGRMETQINRLKEAIEKLNHDCEGLRGKESNAQDNARKLQRQLRDLKEEFASLQQKEVEVNAKKNEFEKLLELAEAETVTARNDLKLALKRIEDLQTAINGELDSESDLNSDADSDSSEEGMENFLEHHRRACSVQRERESVARESMARDVLQRDVRASVARESVARQLETMPEEPELKMSQDRRGLDVHSSDDDEEESQA